MTEIATQIPPAPAPAPVSHQGAAGAIGLICLGVALTLLSLPPGPLPLLVLVADAPFLLLVFRPQWKRWTFLYGVLWFGFTLRWLSEVHPIEVPAAAVVLAPTFLVIGWVLRFATVRLRAPFVVTAGLLLVAEEMVRTIWMGGMPWPMRSLAFASNVTLAFPFSTMFVAGAGLLGAYGLTFIAGSMSAVVSGLPALWRADDAAKPRMRRTILLGLLWPVGAMALLGGWGVLAYMGYIGASDRRFESPPLVAVQATIPQELKNARSGKKILDDHVALSAAALEADGNDEVFGIVWPETMVLWPFYSPELATRFPELWDEGEVSVIRRLRSDVVGDRDLHVFLGAIYRARETEHVYESPRDYAERDSMFHVRPARGPERGQPPGARPDPSKPAWFPPWGMPHGRHDKVRLVPGGEYMPLGDVFPALSRFRENLVPIPVLTPGTEHQRPFQVQLGAPWIEGPRPPGSRVLQVGSIICFDLAFPERLRTWRQDGAEVLLNAANYGWFGPTDFRAQVTAMARLRAAESRTTIVVAGNTGPTLFVDPIGRLYGEFVAFDLETGRVTSQGPAGEGDTTFRTGWAQGRVVVYPEHPPYVSWGDLPWLAAALGVLAWTLIRRRRTRGMGR